MNVVLFVVSDLYPGARHSTDKQGEASANREHWAERETRGRARGRDTWRHGTSRTHSVDTRTHSATDTGNSVPTVSM